MKKFLFLISCLVVFGLVSCKKDVERQSYSVTITNNCSVDILVNVGYVEYDKKNGYDWNNASYSAFKEYMQLGPGENAVVSGKLASNEYFCIGGKISKMDRSWAVDARYKYVYFREDLQTPGNVVLSKYRTDISSLTKKQYSFTIKNECSQDLKVCVGEVPKVSGEYLWTNSNGYTVSYDKELASGASLDITGGLYDGYSFIVDVYKKVGEDYEIVSGWATDPEYITLLMYNGNPDNPDEIWGRSFAKKESKIKDNGDSDIYPLTITNKYTAPVTVFAGDVPYSIKNESKIYNWDAGNPEAFLGKIILEPNESIKIYGKLSGNKDFYVVAWPLYGNGGSGWSVALTNNHADIVADSEWVVGVKSYNESSGSSSSSPILLSAVNPMITVSK